VKRREIGILGEKLARDFLKKKRYNILETNFRCQYGEIDIIARKKDYLVFIEVRTKTSNDFGSPEESVTHLKKEKLVASALSYLSDQKAKSVLWRIDFVAVELDQKSKPVRIELFDNVIN
jgi:putative endonuclease